MEVGNLKEDLKGGCGSLGAFEWRAIRHVTGETKQEFVFELKVGGTICSGGTGGNLFDRDVPQREAFH